MIPLAASFLVDFILKAWSWSKELLYLDVLFQIRQCCVHISKVHTTARIESQSPVQNNHISGIVSSIFTKKYKVSTQTGIDPPEESTLIAPAAKQKRGS